MAKPALGILGVMVSRAGPVCSSVASIERGSAGRSGVLSLDQHSSIGDKSGAERGKGQQRETGAFHEGARLRAARWSMTMVAPGLCWHRPGIRTRCKNA